MPPKKSKKSDFNFNGKLVFLTYAQCPLEKEILLEHLETFGELATYTIGRERHEDGNYHLHACCRYAKKIHTTNVKKFDVENYHPNVKKLSAGTAFKNSQEYCKKEGDFITNEVLVLSKRAQLCKDMLDEGLTPKFVRNNPEVMYLNFSNLRAWLAFANPIQVVLKNLPKKRHYWVSGKANTGKSTWLRIYKELFEAPGIIPDNNDWTLIPYACDLLYFDEFKGQLTVQKLNAVCDGGCHLNTKGGSLVIGQPLVVICSNFSIEECYGNTGDNIISTLHARFNSYVAPSYPRLPMCEL